MAAGVTEMHALVDRSGSVERARDRPAEGLIQGPQRPEAGGNVSAVEDTAIIAYKVHQTGTMKDQPMDLNCADSTTWVRDNGEWKCALHTETILENA